MALPVIDSVTFEAGSVVINYYAPTDLTPVTTAIAELVTKIDQIILNQGAEMAALDDLETKVTAVQGVEDSAALLLKTLHDELVAALGNPARIQAVIDHLAASSDALAAAVAANP